jgi:hypothetical protein
MLKVVLAIGLVMVYLMVARLIRGVPARRARRRQ